MIIAESSPIFLLAINISGAWIHTIYKLYSRKLSDTKFDKATRKPLFHTAEAVWKVIK